MHLFYISFWYQQSKCFCCILHRIPLTRLYCISTWEWPAVTYTLLQSSWMCEEGPDFVLGLVERQSIITLPMHLMNLGGGGSIYMYKVFQIRNVKIWIWDTVHIYESHKAQCTEPIIKQSVPSMLSKYLRIY